MQNESAAFQGSSGQNIIRFLRAYALRMKTEVGAILDTYGTSESTSGVFSRSMNAIHTNIVECPPSDAVRPAPHLAPYHWMHIWNMHGRHRG